MSVMELLVANLDCEGCAAKLRKALFNVKGVDEVEIEMEMEKITVRGYRLEERKLLKAIKNAGKTAEIWPYPYPGHSYIASFYHHYYYDYDTPRSDAEFPSTSAYNFQTPAVYSVAEEASYEGLASFFSDDNPHACTVM